MNSDSLFEGKFLICWCEMGLLVKEVEADDSLFEVFNFRGVNYLMHFSEAELTDEWAMRSDLIFEVPEGATVTYRSGATRDYSFVIAFLAAFYSHGCNAPKGMFRDGPTIEPADLGWVGVDRPKRSFVTTVLGGKAHYPWESRPQLLSLGITIQDRFTLAGRPAYAFRGYGGARLFTLCTQVIEAGEKADFVKLAAYLDWAAQARMRDLDKVKKLRLKHNRGKYDLEKVYEDYDFTTDLVSILISFDFGMKGCRDHEYLQYRFFDPVLRDHCLYAGDRSVTWLELAYAKVASVYDVRVLRPINACSGFRKMAHNGVVVTPEHIRGLSNYNSRVSDIPISLRVHARYYIAEKELVITSL